MWISDETWKLVYDRVYAMWEHRREPRQDQMRIRRLGQAIRVEMKEERQNRVEAEGEDVERLLTGDPSSPDMHGGG